MDIRGKLVELLDESDICPEGITSCIECKYHKEYSFGNPCDVRAAIADKMIANGATVQEWISVDDRLPENGGYVVCIAKRNPFSRFMPMVARIEKNGWVNPMTEQYISEVTHWMQLPQPPKGE